MENLKIFQHPELGKLRAVKQNDQFYFVARDITKILGYKKHNCTIYRHVNQKDRVYLPLKRAGKTTRYALISTRGVLKFLGHSAMPKTDKLREWITEEIIPKDSKVEEEQQKINSLKNMQRFIKQEEENLKILKETLERVLNNG